MDDFAKAMQKGANLERMPVILRNDDGSVDVIGIPENFIGDFFRWLIDDVCNGDGIPLPVEEPKGGAKNE